MNQSTKPQDTILLYQDDKYQGSREEPIDYLREHLEIIDPSCFRIVPIVVQSDKGDIYEVWVYTAYYLASKEVV